MLQHCTMCEGFYNDNAKHRYIDCPYYNGCACGLKQQTAKHVETCFMAKEIKRKKKLIDEALGKDAILQRKEANLIQNSPKSENFVCIYCFKRYSYDRKDHEERYCPYFIGCVFCGLKKVDGKHVDDCKKAQLEGVREEPPQEDGVVYMVCQYCRGDVPFEDWDEHRTKKCGPKLQLIVDETIRKSEAPSIPTRWCWMCDKQIAEDIFGSHLESCKRRMVIVFGKTLKTYYNELPIADKRPVKSSNLKEVQFVEEP